MKQNVNLNIFHDWFANSETYGGNFSWEGQNALFDYLEDYEEQTGKELEFDPIALCVEYTEWDNALDCAREYGFEELDNPKDKETLQEKALEWLQDHTQVIEIPETSRIIILNF